jgi:nucleoside-diphosphate-sugar epimerase
MSIIINESKEIIKNIDFNQLRNSKILITGASGLIGVYLVSCLKQIMKTHNIDIFVWVQNDIDIIFSEIFNDCKIIKNDITDISSFLKLSEFDCIIHAAGYGQPDKFMGDKIKTISLNTTSTIELFNKLKTNGKFLFISTSELYSGIDEQNITEIQIGTTNTNHPRSCYIEGKRCGESICNIYKEKGYDVKIIRLSLAYGPGTKKNDKRVLNSLIQKGLNEDNIKLLDSGDAIRTYCYITDVIEMFWNIFLFGKDLIYNVGGKSVTSIYDLSVLIGSKLNKNVEIPKEINQQLGNPKIVNISIDKYMNEFKKHNFVSLEDGLDKTINWQKKLYNE